MSPSRRFSADKTHEVLFESRVWRLARFTCYQPTNKRWSSPTTQTLHARSTRSAMQKKRRILRILRDGTRTARLRLLHEGLRFAPSMSPRRGGGVVTTRFPIVQPRLRVSDARVLPDHCDGEPADNDVPSLRGLQRVQAGTTERIEAFAFHVRRVRRPAIPSATAIDGGWGPSIGVTIRITSEVRSASSIAIDCGTVSARSASRSRFAIRVQSAIGIPR